MKISKSLLAGGLTVGLALTFSSSLFAAESPDEQANPATVSSASAPVLEASAVSAPGPAAAAPAPATKEVKAQKPAADYPLSTPKHPHNTSKAKTQKHTASKKFSTKLLMAKLKIKGLKK